MGKLSMDLYLDNMLKRYKSASRRQKGELLDELCAASGYHKKHAIRLLNKRKKRRSRPKETRGRPEKYPDHIYLEPLKNIWLSADQLCGKRLKMALPLWLPDYIWLVPSIEGIKREDLPAYPDVVLREVITSSVLHRDYRKMHRPVKIAMFDNRIEIENPGGLMPGLTIYNLIHKRDWRNPLFAEIMKKFGFGEMDGQGIDRLYAETLRIKVPPPIFIDHDNSFSIILSAPKSFEEFSPEEKRLMIIIMIIMHEYIDNKNVRNCFGISSEKATTLIKSLVADKFLQPGSTSRKHAKYILTDHYREHLVGSYLLRLFFY